MSRLALVTATLAALALGCGDKKSSPATAKPAEAAAATGSAAPAPAAAPTARKLGPIDLGAASLDLPALFPGARYLLHPAEDQTGGGSMPDGYAVDTAEIRRGDELLVQAELDGNAVTQLLVFHASIGTPAGVHVGDSAAQLARALPDATCEETKLGVFCSSPKEPGVSFSFGDAGLDGARGSEQPVAKLAADAKIDHIAWSPAQGQRLTLAARPTEHAPAEGGAAGSDDEPGDEGGDTHPPLSKDEADRCARMEVLASKCGVYDDDEFGWIRGTDVKPVSLEAARKACAEPTPTDNPPPRVLTADQLARVEAAQQKSCKAMFKVLDEVDPRMTEAGGHPVEP